MGNVHNMKRYNVIGAAAIADAAAKDAKGGKGGKDEEGKSWLTKKVIGPIPGYGILGILAAVGGGVWYWKFRK